ncbi:methyltransferase [Candidatus Woesearchaeota archaeon]|nr:methyltransferase [Candidatus Woesearchaeota archaeon]
MEEVYEPREDSFLLAEQVKKYAKGVVLDIGTGSGIQAITAAKKKDVKSVIGVDKSKQAIDFCKKNIKNKKIKFIQSDLFSNVKGKFDTIAFNPPYLPEDLRLRDLTIYGGKKGYEIIEMFLSEVNDFLKPDGIILLLFSSLTKKDKVDGFIRNNLFEYKLLDKKHIFFEDLFVYLIKKTELLKKLEEKGIKNLKYFTKGHRGILFTADYKGKKAVIKSKLPESKAVGRIENEGKWLKILNKHKIGPKLFFSEKDYFVYEYIPGLFILDHFKKSNRKIIIKIIKGIFDQMFALDKLKVDKEEMHHPFKHVIITKKNKPVLVDFERCHKTLKPKNVTQFCQCVISMSRLLIDKKIKINRERIIRLAKEYKKNQNKENLNKIKNEISR